MRLTPISLAYERQHSEGLVNNKKVRPLEVIGKLASTSKSGYSIYGSNQLLNLNAYAQLDQNQNQRPKTRACVVRPIQFFKFLEKLIKQILFN